jgi:hypothetical protein
LVYILYTAIEESCTNSEKMFDDLSASEQLLMSAESRELDLVFDLKEAKTELAALKQQQLVVVSNNVSSTPGPARTPRKRGHSSRARTLVSLALESKSPALAVHDGGSV